MHKLNAWILPPRRSLADVSPFEILNHPIRFTEYHTLQIEERMEWRRNLLPHLFPHFVLVDVGGLPMNCLNASDLISQARNPSFGFIVSYDNQKVSLSRVTPVWISLISLKRSMVFGYLCSLNR